MTLNRDDVIRMAREAGFEELFKDSHDWVCFTEEIERFAALVAAAEREELARFFEDHWREEWADFQIATAIRARGQE